MISPQTTTHRVDAWAGVAGAMAAKAGAGSQTRWRIFHRLSNGPSPRAAAPKRRALPCLASLSTATAAQAASAAGMRETTRRGGPTPASARPAPVWGMNRALSGGCAPLGSPRVGENSWYQPGRLLSMGLEANCLQERSWHSRLCPGFQPLWIGLRFGCSRFARLRRHERIGLRQPPLLRNESYSVACDGEWPVFAGWETSRWLSRSTGRV